jgi:hypothetical protein
MDVGTLLDQAVVTLDEAKLEVEAAKAQLEKVLSEIQVAPRAEKTAVSAAIEGALERLRTAHSKVESAERTLASERVGQPR